MRKHTHPLVVATFAVVSSAFGTPTGLNNIPTADTVPHRTVAVQYFSSFGGANPFAAPEAGKTSQWMSFKTGWAFEPFHLEWGMDSLLGTGVSGPLFFQTKARFSPWEDGMFAVGIANIALTGIDRTWKLFDRDFNLNADLVQSRDQRALNADLVQSRDQRALITAVGAKYDLTKHIVLETWANFQDRDRVSAIARINFVFIF